MTNTVACQLPLSRAFDNNGLILAAGLLHTYQAGTTTPLATYQTLNTSTPNANPIVLDSTGQQIIRYLPGVGYKLVLKDPTDTTVLSTVDNFFAPLTDATSIGSVLHPQTAAELSASVTPSNLVYTQGHVRRYGAVGDGTTVDFTAFQSAFAVVLAAGQGAIVCEYGDTYNLGNVTNDGKATPLLTVSALANCVVYGNGATIKTNTTGAVFGAVFGLVNPNNVSFYDLNFFDSGFDQSQNGLPNFKAAHSIFVSNTGSVDSSGITLVNCQASHTGSLLGVWQNSTSSRIRNIQLFGCRELNCFYGPSFQQQGDNVTISGHYCLNPVRAYFPYGVTGHNVDIHVQNDGTNANATSDGLCDIKRADSDTKDIKIRLAFTGTANKYGALINLIHVITSNAPGLIDDIDIDLQLANATFSGTSAGIPVQFTDQTGGSNVSPTANKWDRIKIRGDFGSWTASSLQNPINITSQPTSAGGVGNFSIEGGLSNIVMSTPQAYPGFVVKSAPNKYTYTKTGNLTSGNIPIDLTKYTGTLFCLRVTVYVEADYTTGSTAQSYRQYIIFGNNIAGTVTISSTNVPQTYDSGSGSTVAFTASGNFINVTFTAFTNANAQARVEVEHLSKFLS